MAGTVADFLHCRVSIVMTLAMILMFLGTYTLRYHGSLLKSWELRLDNGWGLLGNQLQKTREKEAKRKRGERKREERSCHVLQMCHVMSLGLYRCSRYEWREGGLVRNMLVTILDIPDSICFDTRPPSLWS